MIKNSGYTHLFRTCMHTPMAPQSSEMLYNDFKYMSALIKKDIE